LVEEREENHPGEEVLAKREENHPNDCSNHPRTEDLAEERRDWRFERRGRGRSLCSRFLPWLTAGSN
jgi:hypothetical protein